MTGPDLPLAIAIAAAVLLVASYLGEVTGAGTSSGVRTPLPDLTLIAADRRGVRTSLVLAAQATTGTSMNGNSRSE